MGDWGLAVGEMQRVALRAMLVVALVNAVVLGTIATATAGSGDRIRIALAFLVAAALAIVPIGRGESFGRDLEDKAWLLAAGALVGAIGLVVGAPARSTLFAAFLTPVGISLLAERWRSALETALILCMGYLLSIPLAGGDSLGGTLGDLLPVGAVIVGGWIPAQLAYGVIASRPRRIHELRATDRQTSQSPRARRVGRPGMSREHDAEILSLMIDRRLRDAEIATELNLSRPQVRDRIQRLVREAGVRDRFELVRLELARRSRTLAAPK